MQGTLAPEAPFRGIRPFRHIDRAIFFARERETRELLDLVTVYRGVMLYGGSGVGKSSLLNAGLAPAASEAGVYVERLRVQPRAEEELVLERAHDGANLLPSLLADPDDEAPRSTLSPDELVRRLHVACERGRPVLVFDQFEEIVTLFDAAGAAGIRGPLVDALVELMRGSLPVKLLFSFREDHLAHIKQLLADCPALIDQSLRLASPGPDALMTLIRGPFERNPKRFARELSPDLAARLITALSERFGQQEVSLAEVQIVCMRLWHAEEPERLLASAGIQGVLEAYLGEALDAFPPDARHAAIALMEQMVTSAGTRDIVPEADLVDRVSAVERIPRGLLVRALRRLEHESRLVRRELRRDVYVYEIASELLVPWIGLQRDLHRRMRERRRQLALAAAAGATFVLGLVIGALTVWALTGTLR